jgi:hypothetical protein
MALCIAAILARRLDSANQALIEVRRQLQADDPRSAIDRAVKKVERVLSLPALFAVLARGDEF